MRLPLLLTLVLTLVLTLGSAFRASATTIVPFPTQAAMVNASDVALAGVVTGVFAEVVGDITYTGYTLTVTEGFRNCVVGQSVSVYHMSCKFGADRMIAAGDLELELGEEYVMCLGTTGAGHLMPLTMGYGVYQRVSDPSTGAEFWVPIENEGIEVLEHPSGVPVEPLMSYPYATFPDLLRASLRDAGFPVEAYAAPTPTRAGLSARAFPPGCTGLFTGATFGSATLAGNRWINPNLSVIQRTGGDAGFGATTTSTVVSNTVAAMNASYQGINLTVGPSNTLPLPNPCSNVTSAVPNNAPAQTIQLYFNDPCNQITNLNGCSGTLGIGGSYVTGTHTYDGAPFGSNAFGYVVVNNGTACLGQANYVLFLAHEMTHAMGLDHIPPSQYPSQNMNPTCCNPINNRDIVCMNYLYAPSVLPVELIAFGGVGFDWGVRLDWATAAENGSDRFEVERSTDGIAFARIGEVEAGGDSRDRRSYRHDDRDAPLGLVYYRLRQLDRDGAEAFSDVIVVDRSQERTLSVWPNPAVVGAALTLSGMQDEEVTITVTDVAGREVFRTKRLIVGGRADVTLPAGLTGGMYYVRTSGAAEALAQSLRLN